MLAGNMLFNLILNNFPEHVRTHILYHCLCNLMQNPYICQKFELRCSESRNFVQNISYAFTHREGLRQIYVGWQSVVHPNFKQLSGIRTNTYFISRSL